MITLKVNHESVTKELYLYLRGMINKYIYFMSEKDYNNFKTNSIIDTDVKIQEDLYSLSITRTWLYFKLKYDALWALKITKGLVKDYETFKYTLESHMICLDKYIVVCTEDKEDIEVSLGHFLDIDYLINNADPEERHENRYKEDIDYCRLASVIEDVKEDIKCAEEYNETPPDISLTDPDNYKVLCFKKQIKAEQVLDIVAIEWSDN